MAARAAEHYTVALQGFSEPERRSLAALFQLALRRRPTYVQVVQAAGCDFLIADADYRPALQAVLAAGRLQDTVFVGAAPPEGAAAFAPRPLDALQLLRGLDALVAQRKAWAAASEAAVSAGVDLLLDEPPASHAPPRAPKRPPPAAGEPPEVLVVDDSRIARRFLEQRLTEFGYRVRSARDADQALAELREHPPALVFLDVRLGGRPGSPDGLELCRQIKQWPPSPGGAAPPQVVLVTALSGPTDRVRGTLAGCDAYLTKPLLPDDFEDTLTRLDPALPARRLRALETLSGWR